MAANSQEATEVQVKNQVLYDLFRSEGSLPSCHDATTLRKWTNTVAKETSIPLKVTQSTMRCIRKRVERVVYEVKQRKHGRQQQEYLDKTWTLPLNSLHLKTKRDLSLEKKLSEAREEVRQLQQENSEVKKTEMKLKEKVVKLSEQIGKARRSGFTPTRGHSQVKPPSKCTKRHQRNLKRKREEKCKESLSWLEAEGYSPTSLMLKNAETGETETISFEHLLGSEERTASEEDLNLLDMVLFLKDKYNISGKAYHELAQLFKEMPRHYKLKQRIAEINSQWNIFPTPAGTTGVQQRLKDRLEVCLMNLMESSESDATFMTEKKVRVKLTGDGTNIGKRLHVVNFGFTVLDEGDKAYSAAGNHCLAVFKEPEDYTSLKSCLHDLREEVKSLTSITVNGVQFEIEYYLGGDWKFLAMVTGISSATSKYACIWCKCPTSERPNTRKKWSAVNTELGARTIDENAAQALSSKHYGVSNPPLFPSIPLTRVVVDNLHLLLRVSDVLIDLLIAELRRLDKVDKARNVSSLESLMYLNSFEAKVKELGMSGFSFWIGSRRN